MGDVRINILTFLRYARNKQLVRTDEENFSHVILLSHVANCHQSQLREHPLRTSPKNKKFSTPPPPCPSMSLSMVTPPLPGDIPPKRRPLFSDFQTKFKTLKHRIYRFADSLVYIIDYCLGYNLVCPNSKR